MLFVLKTTYLIMRACANIRQEAWQVLARLADIRQPVLLGLTKLAHSGLPRGHNKNDKIQKKSYFYQIQSMLTLWQKIDFLFFIYF